MFCLGQFKPLDKTFETISHILYPRFCSSVLSLSSTLLQVQQFIEMLTRARLYLQIPSIRGTTTWTKVGPRRR